MLLKAAARRNVSLTIAEWPGGEPISRTLRVSDVQLEKVARGARNLELGKRQPPVELLGLSWGSYINLRSPTTSARCLADPAFYRGGKWLLGTPFGVEDRKASARTLRKKTHRQRYVCGLDSRSS